MGYARAGFDVTGVDVTPQPNYPFSFHEMDAFDAISMLRPDGLWPGIRSFDAIHASPPCQAYSTLGRFSKHVEYPDFYEQIRDLIEVLTKPWVIENVVGAPYRQGFTLCGSMFGLRVRRHRNFETRDLMLAPHCAHRAQGHPTGVYGHGQFFWKNGEKSWRNVPLDEARQAMGIDWMERRELAESIPPAYTEWIGTRLLENLAARVPLPLNPKREDATNE